MGGWLDGWVGGRMCGGMDKGCVNDRIEGWLRKE